MSFALRDRKLGFVTVARSGNASMGPAALSFLLARQSPESRLSRQVPGWVETPPPP